MGEPPQEVIKRPHWRIVAKSRAARWSKAKWEVLPRPQALELGDTSTLPHGYEVLSFRRNVADDIGVASFAFHGGRHANREWTPRDLLGYDVRLQYAYAVDGDESGELPWRTAWLGVVTDQDDTQAGASSGSFSRVYQCTDLLTERAANWTLSKHHYVIKSGAVDYSKEPPEVRGDHVALDAPGHPGYNTGSGGRDTIGNRWSGGLDYKHPTSPDDPDDFRSFTYGAHSAPGDLYVDAWTDAEVVENVLASCPLLVGYSETVDPIISLDVPSVTPGFQRMLSGVNVWRVQRGDTALSLLRRVLDRRRGAGVAFLDWYDDSSDPLSPLPLFLRVRPHVDGDPDKLEPPAVTRSLDLSEDHRADLDGTNISESSSARVDAVETVGDPIQFVATLSVADGTLEPAWHSDLEDEFLALPEGDERRMSPAFADVFTRYRLPHSWDGALGSGDGEQDNIFSALSLDDDGSRITNHDDRGAGVTHQLVRFMRDLPISGQDEAGRPFERQPAVVWLRDEESNWRDGKLSGIVLRIGDGEVRVNHASTEVAGERYFGPDDESSGVVPMSRFAVTVCLELLQHQLRYRTEGKKDGLRHRTFRAPGHALHMAHPLAVHSLSTEALGDGVPVRLLGDGASFEAPISSGILRDDSESLQLLHNRLAAWHLETHYPATVSVYDLAIHSDNSGLHGTWPMLGEVLTSLTISSGTPRVVSSPVTAIAYDARRHKTVTTTSWEELLL